MNREDRRAAILDAVLPLIREHGFDVSTRQIAEAAGIAEGTIFRVFPDKMALLCAALDQAMDQAGLDEELEELPGDNLEDLIDGIVGVLLRRSAEVGQIMVALRASGHKGAGAHPMVRGRRPRPPQDGADKDPLLRVQSREDRIFRVVADRLTPFADQLNAPVAQTARFIVIFGGAAPRVSRFGELNHSAIVRLLTHGVVKDAA
jgi:AcrR family transcriptional regulator